MNILPFKKLKTLYASSLIYRINIAFVSVPFVRYNVLNKVLRFIWLALVGYTILSSIYDSFCNITSNPFRFVKITLMQSRLKI